VVVFDRESAASNEDGMLKLIFRIGLMAGMCLIGATRARAADPEKIKEAVAKAIEFLRFNYTDPGMTPRAASPNTGQAADDGQVSLAAIALLEAKVPLDDLVIQQIAARAREAAVDQVRTYNLALELIFLDKLGDERDELLIQSIAARLLLGQTGVGGWTYVCPALEESLKERIRKKLGSAVMKGTNQPPQVGTGTNRRPPIDPEIRDMLNKGSPGGSANPPNMMRRDRADDNSNTQFALIAIWSARRHGMPVDACLKMVEQRFRESQIKGGWGYVPVPNVYLPTPAMTCAGLLGFAVSSGMRSEHILKARSPPAPGEKIKSESGKDSTATAPNPLKDPAVRAAIDFLTAAIKASRNGLGDKPAAGLVPGAGGFGGGGIGFTPRSGDLRENLYFLWSLERVCVVFGLKRFGDCDWYDWGAEWLVARQTAKGSWSSAYGPVPDTAFGLMFLVHANIVRDLTQVLKATSGPESAEPRSSNNKNPKDGRGSISTDGSESALAQALLKAGAAKQAALIKEYAEKHGNQYSLALAEAIPKLTGGAQEDARSALASRMARQKSDVVRHWFEYDNAEIRRAAAVGASIHDEAKLFVPDLLKMLDDPEEIVWRGVGLALRTISKKTYGPRKGDSDDERQKAKAEWEAWWKTQQ
jgi:hypothetical protein